LVCLRNGEPFSDDEVEALLTAAEHSYSWQVGNPDWTLRLVPLPFGTSAPPGASRAEFATWISKTPFVPPGNRHRFRGNGRERAGELPREVLRKLIVKHGLPAPLRIEPLDAGRRGCRTPESLAGWSEIGQWVSIHETRAERLARRDERTRAVRPGYRFRIVFPEPVPGPICLGHSAHFGLGLFRAGRWKAMLSANRELIALYWDIGRRIVERECEGWGRSVVDRLAADIQQAFRDSRILTGQWLANASFFPGIPVHTANSRAACARIPHDACQGDSFQVRLIASISSSSRISSIRSFVISRVPGSDEGNNGNSTRFCFFATRITGVVR
jgi:hypothetical protein